jgi:DNA ligase-1
MKDVIVALNQLRGVAGNRQLDVLKSYAHLALLKSVLLYTYDPHKKYKIDEGKLNKFIVAPSSGFDLCIRRPLTEEIWYLFKRKLDELSNKRSAKDVDVQEVANIINSLDTDGALLAKQILFKDLRLGMGIRKIQKVWNQFCLEPQVQLANLYQGVDFNLGYYSRKFDGKRVYFKQGDGYSRANKLCKPAPIKHIARQTAEYADYILDGELIYFDEQGNEDFQKAISLTASDAYDEDCKNLYYVVFDMIPKHLFMNKELYVSFEDEYMLMLDALGASEAVSAFNNYSVLKTKHKNILLARQDKTNEKLEELRQEHNWEGLMYRNGEESYEYKRTSNLLKIKRMNDAEFDIVEMSLGTGRHSGRLGTLVVALETGDLVGVGSGFKDEQRNEFWVNRELICSPEFKSTFKAKVQFFERTYDSSGSPSLRFPVFKAFRSNTTNSEYTSIESLKGELQ